MLHRMTSGYEALSNANFLASMYSGVEFIDAFGSAFSASVARERPADSSNEYTFAPEGARAHGGMLVRVRPDGVKPWRGMFAYGDATLSGLWAAPGPYSLVAISFGIAYLLDVRSPDAYHVIGLLTTHVLPVPDVKILVVADRNALRGIGVSGISWGHICSDADGFEQITLSERFVNAVAKKLGSGGEKMIRIDARSGELFESDNA
jgi:hypothetical protein